MFYNNVYGGTDNGSERAEREEQELANIPSTATLSLSSYPSVSSNSPPVSS
ncbi:hypothetical protein DICPUDRAFT_160360 [Dictyostelium purpureum]|uniref:Uncharacterized protein n=1 Tax=Dictyostelium purpureum TaxID=5786 RepID=F1A673_DICPU|nr:uncharacterized protein DICPUDRAFT_160360 [Dictyostelium purpureum]EGC28307.1 hypothetical protein DICPUDRAFT_160360 [Dictyostelium purpureum]|eukprot:XP_003295167.1 hypothetical protein DICPUDRAFT_160360 [Dictyostelium purpureum]